MASKGRKSDVFTTVSCTNCEDEIHGVRVQCCVCPNFELCLQCFSSGAEIGPHRNDHSYKFAELWSTSIFGGRGNWSSGEELQLLDAIELYGFGNWELISQKIKTRTPEEVKEKYITRYLNGNIGRATWAECQNKRPVIVNHIVKDLGPLSPFMIAKLPPLIVTPDEAHQLDYRPLRDDYEREYDMQAEQLVSSLQLDPVKETDMELALKLSKVDMYSRRLKERARRKRIVRDYQLVNKFFANQRKDCPKPLMPKEERELRETMKPFSKFLTSAEHDRLINNILREQELRHRLSELYRYRSVGLSTQEEIFHYEQHEAFRKQQQSRNPRSGSSGFPISTHDTQENDGGEEKPNLFEEKYTPQPFDEPENNLSNVINFKLDNFDPLSKHLLSPHNLPITSLLSEQEIKLCTYLNLLPIQYITLKSHIIQENLTAPIKYDRLDSDNPDEINVKDVVIEYLSHSGWLPRVETA